MKVFSILATIATSVAAVEVGSGHAGSARHTRHAGNKGLMNVKSNCGPIELPATSKSTVLSFTVRGDIIVYMFRIASRGNHCYQWP